MKLVSIIIANYNGQKYLKNCLDSIFCQTYKNIQVIMVDNNSSDNSVDFVSKNYPQVEIVQTGANLGYAGGNNAGLKYAKGEYIMIINNDIYLEDGFFEKMLKAFDEIPNLGSIQPKLVLAKEPHKLDACGTYWLDVCIILHHFGFQKNPDLPLYNKPTKVFANKGACMLIKKDVIDKIGLFFDDYWCYYEETDFCHRLWLSGYECRYYPASVCYHENGGTASSFDNAIIQYHNLKNKFGSLIQNFEVKTLIYMIPLFIFYSILLSIFWLFTFKARFSLSIYKAFFWDIKNMKMILQRRKKIQSLRKKTDKEIFKNIKRKHSLSYYYYFFTGLQKYEDEET